MGAAEDRRFDLALYSVADAASYLRLSPSTLGTWADGYVRGRPGHLVQGAPVVTAFERTIPGAPRLPFVGLAEAYVLAAFRRAGVPLQRIRPFLQVLRAEVGDHALASKHLYTDGAEVLWNHAHRSGQGGDQEVVRRLVVPRSGQYVFRDVVEQYLRQVRFAGDGYASSIALPQYARADVVVDPERNFGHPIFDATGVSVAAVLGRLGAGEAIAETAQDYGLATEQLQAALAVAA